MIIYYNNENPSSSIPEIESDLDKGDLYTEAQADLQLLKEEKLQPEKKQVVWEKLSKVIDNFFDAKANKLNELAIKISNGVDIHHINKELNNEANILVSFVDTMSKFIKVTNKEMKNLHTVIKGDDGFWFKLKKGLLKLKEAIVNLLSTMKADKSEEEQLEERKEAISKFENVNRAINEEVQQDVDRVDDSMQKIEEKNKSQELENAIKLDSDTKITPNKKDDTGKIK